MDIDREKLADAIHAALDEHVGSGTGTDEVTDAVIAALPTTMRAERSTTCPHWHLVHADEESDLYAYSEADTFRVEECRTVQVPVGHGVVCDRCRHLLPSCAYCQHAHEDHMHDNPRRLCRQCMCTGYVSELAS